MSEARDETDRLRVSQGTLSKDASQVARCPDPGAVSFLGQTTTAGSYPTTANAFYAITPLDVTGAEVEGGAATSTALLGRVYAWNCGTAVPPAGTKRIITGVPYRFVFQFNG